MLEKVGRSFLRDNKALTSVELNLPILEETGDDFLSDNDVLFFVTQVGDNKYLKSAVEKAGKTVIQGQQ
jgi:hypothetical protein